MLKRNLSKFALDFVLLARQRMTEDDRYGIYGWAGWSVGCRQECMDQRQEDVSGPGPEVEEI